jgi:undecaprenyl-phosphate 4-deoxy-4-formamido-L-arabinose transferase
VESLARAEHDAPQTVSVVIPVYQGEATLGRVVAEIAAIADGRSTALGHAIQIDEVVLVYDNGPDNSDEVIRELAREYNFVKPVWLSRNYGQHAATLAGMASTGSDWIVTMDEDGQHDPLDIPRMIDTALETRAPLVYATPTNRAPHGPFRNAASRSTKWFFAKVLSENGTATFSSYRLVLGELGRSVAAYCGPGVYLDVAFGWVIGRTARCPVELRQEGDRRSGYSFRRLVSHFWRLVLTSGTRPLRLASLLGFAMALVGFAVAVAVLIQRLFNDVTVQGWASVIVTVLVGTGAVLLTLGIVAEYVGVAVKMAMGKPLYLITRDPASTALGRVKPEEPAE